MSVRGFVGKIFLEIGEGSPSSFTRICEVTDLGEIGETNELIEDTDFCSDGTREYIAGLSDGDEFTWALKFKQDPTSKIRTLIDAVKDKATLEFRIVVEELSPALLLLHFFAVALSWKLAPSFTERNTMNFTGKITGPVDFDDV